MRGFMRGFVAAVVGICLLLSCSPKDPVSVIDTPTSPLLYPGLARLLESRAAASTVPAMKTYMSGLIGYAGLGLENPAATTQPPQTTFCNVNQYGLSIAGTALLSEETSTLSAFLAACNAAYAPALDADLIAAPAVFIAALNAAIAHAYATPADTAHNILAAVLSLRDGAIPLVAPTLTGATPLSAEQVFLLSTMLAGCYLDAATTESVWKQNALFRSQLVSGAALLSAIPSGTPPLRTSFGDVPLQVGAMRAGFGAAMEVLASGMGEVVAQSLPNATNAVWQTISIPVVNYTSVRSLTPLQYTFDASSSTDRVEPLSSLRFRWTFDVDGVAYRTTYSSTPTATCTFADTGTYSVMLEVANSQGIVSATYSEVAVPSPTVAASKFAVSVSVDTAQGSVKKVPDAATYDSATQVALVAAAKTGFRFTGWSGDISGAVRGGDTLKIAVNAAKSITAVFSAKPTYALSLTIDTSLGSMTKSPSAAAYDSGVTVTLTPTPKAGCRFDGWAGDTSGVTRNGDAILVAMRSAKSLTARFSRIVIPLPRYSLTIAADTSMGVVMHSPDSATFDSGAVVKVWPFAKRSHKFTAWSGDTSGAQISGDTLVVTMTASKSLSAGFVRLLVTQYALVVLYDTTRGTVLRVPNDSSYDSGTVVSLIPQPKTGFAFAEWEKSPYGLDVRGDTLKVTMLQQRSDVAVFYPTGMAQIPGGSFVMGTDDPSVYGYAQAGPAHSVTVSSFSMDRTHVSQAQYTAVMGYLPQDTTPEGDLSIVNTGGVNKPVVVDYFGAVRYCIRKSAQEGLASCYDTTDPSNWKCDITKNGYRLPTEAEWEYACKAGTSTAFYWGSGLDGGYLWYHDNSGDTMHIVGQKLPNAWGLYDMMGNNVHWTGDWFSSYTTTAQTDPAGPATPEANIKAVRGAGCFSWAQYVATTLRFNFMPEDVGPAFRCVKR